jgi:hypothetical protein
MKRRGAETFDKIQHHIHEIKQKAIACGDDEIWGLVDSLYWILLGGEIGATDIRAESKS